MTKKRAQSTILSFRAKSVSLEHAGEEFAPIICHAGLRPGIHAFLVTSFANDCDWIATASEASHPPDNASLCSAGRKTDPAFDFRLMTCDYSPTFHL